MLLNAKGNETKIDIAVWQGKFTLVLVCVHNNHVDSKEIKWIIKYGVGFNFMCRDKLFNMTNTNICCFLYNHLMYDKETGNFLAV